MSDSKVLNGEGCDLTDNVGLNWRINVVDVLRNGTIQQPSKIKACGCGDNSHKGLLMSDVPFVFVRPLRETSLPFFEKSCTFMELDVEKSNCVEVILIDDNCNKENNVNLQFLFLIIIVFK